MKRTRIRKYIQGKCSSCPLSGRIIKDGLCYSCYQDQRIISKLYEIEKDFSPRSEYNDNIFNLYLSYIKRYRLSYSIKNQVLSFTRILEKDEIVTIKSWFDIYCLSDTYCLYQRNSTAKGCAFIKVGKMLQELGVLPPRESEIDRQIQTQFSYFHCKKLPQEFSEALQKIATSKDTILDYLYALKDFSLWLFHAKQKDLIEASTFDISEYIEIILPRNHSHNYVRLRYHHLKRYFEWLFYKNYISTNPYPKIKINRNHVKINIIDEHTIQKLFAFIRNKNSNPEQALMITLGLIWGLQTIELAQAQIIIREKGFDIKLRRKELTKGKKYYNRPEVIILPKTNNWFLNLQKRYLIYWQQHYDKIKKTYPISPFFLHRTFHSTNFLCTDVIRHRFQDATMAAVGKKITNKVMRQTCGHLASLSGDASMLSNLGWSDQFAFHYTWLPREILAE